MKRTFVHNKRVFKKQKRILLTSYSYRILLFIFTPCRPQCRYTYYRRTTDVLQVDIAEHYTLKETVSHGLFQITPLHWGLQEKKYSRYRSLQVDVPKKFLTDHRHKN